MNRHLCFYSAYDPNSRYFLEQLSQTPFAREFQFVCVDPPKGGGPRPALPPYVRAVPTLMIIGESGPRVDNAVINWLSERRLRARAEETPAIMGGGLSGGGRPITMPQQQPQYSPQMPQQQQQVQPGSYAPPNIPRGAPPPTEGGPFTDMTGERGGFGLSGFYGAGDFATGGDEPFALINENTDAMNTSGKTRIHGNMAGYGYVDTVGTSGDHPGGRSSGHQGATSGGHQEGFPGGHVSNFAGGAAYSSFGDSGSGRVSEKERQANAAYEALIAARNRDIPMPPERR